VTAGVNLTFVVSSGRAGSTLLSQILHEHPDVLSVSEFFADLQGVLRRMSYPGQEMDGAQLWRILSAPDVIADAVVRQGLHSPEMLYPYGRGRFSPADGIPVICHSTLPLLSGDPDALFDQLAAELPGWPVRPAADQYRALFAYLAGMFGRTVVVERSGGSLLDVGLLHREFPEARFVHMFRYGPDCALSMSRFPMFKVGAVTFQAAQDAGLPAWSTWPEIQDALPERYAGLLSPPYDLSRLSEFEFGPVFFGGQWSDMITYGVGALGKLPSAAWDTLAYEDLMRDPTAQLTRLSRFLGIEPTPAWLAVASRLADPGRVGKSAVLDRGTLTAVREACAPGTAALQTQTRYRAQALNPQG
jgi:Sulfotransferase family